MDLAAICPDQPRVGLAPRGTRVLPRILANSALLVAGIAAILEASIRGWRTSARFSFVGWITGCYLDARDECRFDIQTDDVRPPDS